MFALISSRSGSQRAMLLMWALQGHHGPLVFSSIEGFSVTAAPLGFWYLLHTCSMTCCIVQDRISIIMLIIPFIVLFSLSPLYFFPKGFLWQELDFETSYTHWMRLLISCKRESASSCLLCLPALGLGDIVFPLASVCLSVRLFVTLVSAL